MKKWYYWLFLSLLFAIGGILNCLDGEKMITAFLPAIGTTLLAIIQFLCDKRGETGKKAFKYICIGIIVLLAVFLIYLLFT